MVFRLRNKYYEVNLETYHVTIADININNKVEYLSGNYAGANPNKVNVAMEINSKYLMLLTNGGPILNKDDKNAVFRNDALGDTGAYILKIEDNELKGITPAIRLHQATIKADTMKKAGNAITFQMEAKDNNKTKVELFADNRGISYNELIPQHSSEDIKWASFDTIDNHAFLIDSNLCITNQEIERDL